MSDAYGTLANGGTHIPATIINKVVFPDGSSENFGDPKSTQVFPDGQAYAATQVLKQVITSGTGTAAGYGCPAAGKTGTANNLENAWFVGYTPRMSTAVWVGYPQGNIPMADGFGGALAAPIWHDYMESASSGYCGDFPHPTVPFHGTAYFGHFAQTGGSNSVSGDSGLAPGANGTGSTTGGTTGGTTTGTSGGGTSTNQYNNPTLFSQPTTPSPSPSPGTGGGAVSGGGKHH
jgi:penicillin-binding protein 1A